MEGSESPKPPGLAPSGSTPRRTMDLQEKNRKAQRRFRARQKARHSRSCRLLGATTNAPRHLRSPWTGNGRPTGRSVCGLAGLRAAGFCGLWMLILCRGPLHVADYSMCSDTAHHWPRHPLGGEAVELVVVFGSPERSGGGGRTGAQAKVGELEETVEGLNGRISLLATEKAALDSRVGILTRVLRMREEHIETLQRKETFKVPPPPSPPASPPAHTNTLAHTHARRPPESRKPSRINSSCLPCAVPSAWTGPVASHRSGLDADRRVRALAEFLAPSGYPACLGSGVPPWLQHVCLQYNGY